MTCKTPRTISLENHVKLSLVCGTCASCHKAGKTHLALLEKYVINKPPDKNPLFVQKRHVIIDLH